MRKINILEIIDECIEKIREEREINGKITSDYSSDKSKYITKLNLLCSAIGLDYNLSTESQTIMVIVPKDSELFCIDREGNAINLYGKELAKGFKKVFIKLLSASLGEDIEKVESVTKVKYKEHGNYVTYDEYLKIFNEDSILTVVDYSKKTNDLIDDIKQNKMHSRHIILCLERFATVQQYGIDFDLKDILNITKMNDKQIEHLTITVPEKSKYIINGKELSGKNAFDYAINTLKEIVPLEDMNVSFDYRIIDGLIWDKEKFEEETSRLRSVIEVLKNSLCI